MGYRAHALTKREIEYGDGKFNWQTDKLKDILRAYCPTSFFGGDEWGDGEDWEISKTEFKKMLAEIEGGTKEDFCNKTEIEFGLSEDEMTYEDMVSALRTLYEQGCKAGKEFIYITLF